MLDDAVQWYVLLGVLLVSTSALGPLLQSRWVSPVHLQLIGGVVAGPWLLGLIHIDLMSDTRWLEVASEIAVIISLYAAGIKLRIPLSSPRWRPPLLLASLTMVATVLLTSLLGMLLLALPWPVALLLGAVLAPTDPVLADKVQVEHPGDDDRLRQSLTGEAGMNDGTAFPFVLLAVAWINPDHASASELWWDWIVNDLLWKVSGGVLFGAVAGYALAKAVFRLRRLGDHRATSEELLTLGVISIVYGIALALDTYAFLAVFAAAVSLRNLEMQASRNEQHADPADRTDSTATHRTAGRQIQRGQAEAGDRSLDASALIREQTEVGSALERVAQVFLVLMVGALLASANLGQWRVWLFAVTMIAAVRPLAVLITLRDASLSRIQIRLIAWFGIRGIGTIYYLTHALEQGLRESNSADMQLVADCCITTILLSIFVHGMSDTPLMRWYRGKTGHAQADCSS